VKDVFVVHVLEREPYLDQPADNLFCVVQTHSSWKHERQT
jgi:hypothetical protein